MNLRLLPLTCLRRSRNRSRSQMRLDSCCWSSLSKRHALSSSSSKQVLITHSHLKKPGNHQPEQQQQQQQQDLLGRQNATVAFNVNDGVHLSPKPQRVHSPAAPVQIPRPQRPAESFYQNDRVLPLRERLQVVRRTRFQDFNRNRRPAAAPPATSNFGSIVSKRINSPAAGSASTSQRGQQEDTFSPLVKAIFDLLDQPMPSRKEPLPVPRVKLPKENEWPDEYYQQQRHRYRVYQQAFNTGDPRFDSLGRTLCRILRHQATQLGLPIRSNGYVKLDDILNLSIMTHAGIAMNAHSVDEVLDVVERDPKQRYSTMVEDGKIYVRANQGHSMRAVVSDHLLTEITSAEQVPVCVHGTYKCFLPSIMRSGLNRMSRNHVHFAIGLPTDEGVLSGMMDSVEVLIYLDVARALRDGMKLYISDNKVLLTEGFAGVVPCDYFEKVVEWPSFALAA